MAMKINFDLANVPESPTFILATNSGIKLGQLNVLNINSSDALNDASEISFDVKKSDEDNCRLWNKIVDFKLLWCKEYDLWYQIQVDISDSNNEVSKSVSCIQLGQAELGQIMLYDIQINTEDDIAREDYKAPTVIYDENNPESSLLDRILEKAPHYSVIHVDATIAKIQRTFEFDNKSIYDAFEDIAEEIGCLFVLHSNSDENGINRTISVYDIQSNCHDCGYRGEFTSICPECGSINIDEGYGEDTTIFITSDELADNINFTTDTNSVKNCFKLEAGDDLMTATIRNCNPNGTDYIWYLSDDVKEDMSEELVTILDKYDKEYIYYQKEHLINIDEKLTTQYNSLVEKYQVYNEDLKIINIPIIGYPALMTAYYNTIDLALYLKSSLMPDASMDETDAIKEAEKLTSNNLSPIAVENVESISLATSNNVVLSISKIVVDSRYKVAVETSSLSDKVWTGNFTVTNYTDEEDTATSETISIQINDDYETFVKQKIDKMLNKEDSEDLSISGLFAKDYDDFCEELKKYCLTRLTSFHNAAQSCIDILIEQGIADSKTWANTEPNLYNDLYQPYLLKLKAIESETKIREDELNLILGIYDENENLIEQGLQTYIIEIKNDIQSKLNFQDYIGKDLWLEFCTYRREDKYSNDNYISDGLNNVEIFEKALEFIKVANDEIYKSANLQHSITSSLKNLLVMKKFKKLVNYFEVGNWIRIKVDEDIYKLRLLSYKIDYNNLDNIDVEFSDVLKTADGLSDQRSIIQQASTMATSYSSVQKQANQGAESNKVINDWFASGLDATNTKIVGGADNQTQTWDSHGMLFRKYNDITESYDDIQLKIINSTIAITDDNWETTRAALGNFYYHDPKTNELKNAYGINGEVIVGRLLLGEELGIYNESGTLTFDKDGLEVSNNENTFSVNPNSQSVLSVKNKDKYILSFDEKGNLIIVGDITATSLTLADDVEINSNHIEGLDEYISLETIYGKDSTSSDQSYLYVSKDGLLTAKNALIYGTVYATNGKFAGEIIAKKGTIGDGNSAWNIGDSSIYSGTSNMDSNDDGIYIGTNGIREYYSGTYLNITNSAVYGGKGSIKNAISFDNAVDNIYSMAFCAENSIQLRSPKLYVGTAFNPDGVYAGVNATFNVRAYMKVSNNGGGVSISEAYYYYTLNFINGILVGFTRQESADFEG